MEQLSDKLDLSACADTRILNHRHFADLEDSEDIATHQISEAIHYHSLGRILLSPEEHL